MAAALALIVSAGSTANQYLAQHVTELGYQRPVFAASANAARRMIAEKPYEMILINAPLPDELGHELALFAVQNTRAGVLMMVKAGTAEQVAQRVEQSGVLVLAKPFSGVAFRQAVHMAAASSRRLMMLQAENDKLNLARYAYLLARLQPKRSSGSYALYNEFSKQMYAWACSGTDRLQLVTAIYLYVYMNRKAD